ncbi:MAG TPA: PEP-CTERM sorting domain-containing protein [Gemmataceae bacterium]|jgi:hypothetical protein|nr:PEP-CTERM sorting domain-containing protein [Gemmataceae bacterium]
MTSRLIPVVAALAVALSLPAAGFAFFPPDVFPPTNQGTPPDPFTPPGAGGLGEPEPVDPDPGPTVQTPEPASIVTGLTGLALAAAYGWRKKRALK